MVRKRRGAALPELVTVQAVILIALVFATFSVGDALESSFLETSNALGVSVADSKSLADNASSSSPTAATTSGATNNVGDSSVPPSKPFWMLLPVALVMIATTGLHCLYLRYRNQQGMKKRQEIQDAEREERASICPDRLRAKREKIADILGDNWKSVLDNKLTVKHFMTPHATVVSPRDSIHKIRELVRHKQFRHLIVQDSAGEVVGVISDRDEIYDEAHRVDDVMTRNPIVVHQDVPVMSAVSQMISNRISCLPVVSDSGLVGILTTSDVLIAFQCTLRTVEKIRQTLHLDQPESLQTEPALV